MGVFSIYNIVYSTRASFMRKLQELLKDEDFEPLYR